VPPAHIDPILRILMDTEIFQTFSSRDYPDITAKNYSTISSISNGVKVTIRSVWRECIGPRIKGVALLLSLLFITVYVLFIVLRLPCGMIPSSPIGVTLLS